jgi:hypothetical protein
VVTSINLHIDISIAIPLVSPRGVDSLEGVVYHVWPRGIFLGGILMAWTN